MCDSDITNGDHKNTRKTRSAEQIFNAFYPPHCLILNLIFTINDNIAYLQHRPSTLCERMRERTNGLINQFCVRRGVLSTNICILISPRTIRLSVSLFAFCLFSSIFIQLNFKTEMHTRIFFIFPFPSGIGMYFYLEHNNENQS